MKQVDAFIVWFLSHRTQFGGLCGSVGAVLMLASQFYPSQHLVAAGAIIALIGTHLMTGGMSESDHSKREARKVVETRIDRRNPESLVPIPAKDLRKLVAKDPKLAKGEQE